MIGIEYPLTDPRVAQAELARLDLKQSLGENEKRSRTACRNCSAMKVRDVIRRLNADGWYRIRSASGHRQFKHPFKLGRVTMSGQLNVDVPTKTLKSIWKQAGISEESP